MFEKRLVDAITNKQQPNEIQVITSECAGRQQTLEKKSWSRDSMRAMKDEGFAAMIGFPEEHRTIFYVHHGSCNNHRSTLKQRSLCNIIMGKGIAFVFIRQTPCHQ